MILAVPDPQNVQFGPRPWVISAAMLFVHSCTPITEGAQFLMKLIKNGFRRLQRRLGNSSIEFSFRQLIESVLARVIIRPSPAIDDQGMCILFARRRVAGWVSALGKRARPESRWDRQLRLFDGLSCSSLA